MRVVLYVWACYIFFIDKYKWNVLRYKQHIYVLEARIGPTTSKLRKKGCEIKETILYFTAFPQTVDLSSNMSIKMQVFSWSLNWLPFTIIMEMDSNQAGGSPDVKDSPPPPNILAAWGGGINAFVTGTIE